MGKWIECTISDLGTVVGGATPSTKKKENYENGTIAWLTPRDLAGYNRRYISRGERNITEQGLNSCSTQLLPANTVLFSSRAPIGYVAIAQNELCTNQGFKSVVPNANTDPVFLYYLLKYYKPVIENMGSGTTFKEVSGNTMRGVKVTVPVEIEDQKKIAQALSCIDEKIELNQDINNALMAQCEAIFKRMFVDDESCASWRTGALGDIIVSTLAGDWGKEEATGSYSEKVYCVRGADIPEVKIGNKGKMPTRFILPKNYKNKMLVAGDVVVEISGGSPTQSTGRVAMISQSLLDRYDQGMVCTNFCKALKPKNGYSMFLYFYWQYLYDRDVFFAYENGTTGIKNLDINGVLQNEEIQIPPMDVAGKFDMICQDAFEQIFANGLENERLTELRDLLLQKLMSGDLDYSSVKLEVR